MHMETTERTRLDGNWQGAGWVILLSTTKSPGGRFGVEPLFHWCDWDIFGTGLQDVPLGPRCRTTRQFLWPSTAARLPKQEVATPWRSKLQRHVHPALSFFTNREKLHPNAIERYLDSANCNPDLRIHDETGADCTMVLLSPLGPSKIFCSLPNPVTASFRIPATRQ